LVLAGAGSGKTRVLTYRIAHLVRHLEVRPWRILAVTFTNKAAGEMRHRLEQLIGAALRDLWVGTFHSVCARLLRLEAEAFGLDPNYTIYDEDDRRAVMRQVLERLQISDQDLAPAAAIAQISRAKNSMLGPEEFADDAGASPPRRRLAQVFAAYQSELRQRHAFDFDDLIVEPVRQFQQHPEVLRKYQERLRYLLIDEYQDTNRPQYLLARQLADGHRNLCCVGDDDQSIYQFRGADIRNILEFEKDYPEAVVVRLEQNYRSTGRILQAANAVIQNNRSRKGKELWTAGPQGDPLDLVECRDDRAEARYIVTTVSRLVRQQGVSPAAVAVLYRTNAQSRPLEEELQRSGLPYLIVGSIRFYERREIKDLLAYLRLLVNPADDTSLLRVVNVPRRGLGDTSLAHLQAHARSQGLTLSADLAQLDQIADLSTRARKSLEGFHRLLCGLRARVAAAALPELGQEVLEQSGYLRMLQEEDTPEAEVRQKNVEQLVAFMTEFAQTREDTTLTAFLAEVALMAPVDEVKDTQQEAITLMTLHSAKGLEFPRVFISGMEEDLFPTSRAVAENRENPRAIEEERRLFYVGLTRARDHLVLTYACRRYSYGALVDTLPSRFLEEVPRELVQLKVEGDELERPRDWNTPRPAGRPRPARVDRQPAASKGVHYEWEETAPAREAFSQVVDGDDFLSPGRWVLHPTWGRGQIVGREGQGEKTKLAIRFGRTVKKVIASYAQLEPG
jgi:DNA helicase-2/ATP-dependent DNA helicase PcrA